MFNIQEELKKLPEKPGVYIMRDENNEIIYIGKAVSLKNRVRQYFQSQTNMSPKTRALVSRIHCFEFIVTNTELEALILECNLIKKHKPKFNILLKDDKSYPYIKVTMNEEYPRVFMTRRLEKDGAKYFGPYSNVLAVRETLDLLKKLFPIKVCNKVLPRDAGKERPCLNYHIYQCLGPCQGDVNREEYRNLMKDICSFLGGKQEEAIKRLEAKMKEASENMEFERAAGIRDKIISLKHIAEKQKVISSAMEDQDVIAFSKSGDDSCVQVFFIRAGKLIGREHFIMEALGEIDDHELMTSFVKQFYSKAAYVPGEILLQSDIDELNIIESWLNSKRGTKVYLKVPRKGEKLKLIEMVAENANIALRNFKEKLENDKTLAKEALRDIAEALDLDRLPLRIEAYDISNTGSSEIVGSMVVFENGNAAKKEYRKFRIKGLETQNDYGSMQEVIYRRFKRAEEEKSQTPEKEKKFSKLPDLILLDGGLGHVNSVKEVLQELAISIPIAGMVKNDRHRTRGLIWKDGEIDLLKNPKLLKFVTSIQDEAHRFAVEYNRKLRNKRYEGSVLDEIEGIGSKRKKTLIKHFGSVKKIKSAELEELLAVEGINRAVAEKIYEYFHD
ncbi:MAG: excinuclease ABC subunit UvrC [Clostridia bacterium]|nr:excinuclease ABC subunit UvrC [Clostridia bacterium]